MIPDSSFKKNLAEMYSDSRVAHIIRRLLEAQDDLGFATVLAEMSGGGGVLRCLVWRQSDGSIETRALAVGEYLIGRSSKCQILIDRPTVSRVHCLLTVHGGGRAAMRDLRSKNGTWVDGKRLSPEIRKIISVSDQLSIGYTPAAVIGVNYSL